MAMDSHAGRFRYRGRFVPYRWLGAFLPLSLILTIEWVKENGALNGTLFAIVAIGFVLVSAYFLLLAVSDIAVNGEALCRIACRVRWQRLRWADVAAFTVVDLTDPSTGRTVRSYGIAGRHGEGCILTRYISFQERMPEMESLLQAVRQHVDEHHIPIRDLRSAK